jgi:putative sugar O-methyltransferase
MKTINKKKNFYGWIAAENETLSDYTSACLEAVEYDNEFSNFRKNEKYRTILEGAPKLFSDYYVQKINSHLKKNLFYSNLEKFKENDKIGNPDLYDESEIGLISPSTLKFAFNAIDIVCFLEQQSQPLSLKNIIEIGGGYGGLCLLLSNLIEFESYTLIDLPEACKLAQKYISNFEHLKDKVNFVPCDKLSSIKKKDFDLVIAVNSLSECNLETQLDYFDKFVSKSNFSYIVRNPDTQERFEHHVKTIDSLPENFLVDDTNKVEEWYSSNIIVYIKRGDETNDQST